MTTIVWLSDFHLSTEGSVLGFDSVSAARQAVDHVARTYPDAACCVLSGDLVDHGTREEYLVLQEILETLPMPWLPLVGNHDNRETLRAALALPKNTMGRFIQYSHDVQGDSGVVTRLLCLDTLVPGEGGGHLCSERLGWLQTELDASQGVPVLVFLHHPPVKLGQTVFDEIGLDNSEDVMSLLTSYPNVKYALSGHVHRAYCGVYKGLPYATQRSVLFQAPPSRPAWGWDSFSPSTEPPGYGIIELGQDLVRVSFNQVPAP